ncbi:MAG TPA: HAD-IB family phosphatase [Candidatus Acidoferrales bacterium]|nr:HAD-IB family phosphatase [Candidatus Acidoferrales bacterium]
MTADSQIGAFFDLDGTLMPWPSLEWRFVTYLGSRDVLGPRAAMRQLAAVIENAIGGYPLARNGWAYLDGVLPSLVNDWLADKLEPFPIFEDGLRRLEWHACQGHHVAIISGTLAPLARAFARQLGISLEVHATELSTARDISTRRARPEAGRWTGQQASEWPNGMTKAQIVQRIASAQHLELARSFAYGNSAADAEMLAATGLPRAVNPSPGLRRIAGQRRWVVESWRSRAELSVIRAPHCPPAARIENHRS